MARANCASGRDGALVVGVLAIQGDFDRHLAMLARIEDVTGVQARFPEDFANLDGLIIPGGESTTFTILFDRWGMRERIADFIESDRPVWGTCAGAIVLASRVLDNDKKVDVRPLNAVDLTVLRNGFGRQVDSFEAPVALELNGAGNGGIMFNGVFIRAPRFSDIGNEARVIGTLSGEPVMIEQGNVMVTSFHPELTGNDRVHRYFIGKVRANRESVS